MGLKPGATLKERTCRKATTMDRRPCDHIASSGLHNGGGNAPPNEMLRPHNDLRRTEDFMSD
jgi:hypothetical protein